MSGIFKIFAAMKKIMNIFVLVAAAAMAFVSCQKSEIYGAKSQVVNFTITAGISDTKTTIVDNGDGTYTPSWNKGDKIGVILSSASTVKDAEFENTADDGEIANFQGKHTFEINEGNLVEGDLCAFYPSSSFNKIYSNGEFRLDLIANQNPTSTSFDPSCDLLVARPCHYTADATGEEVDVKIAEMYFARLMSVIRINLNSKFLQNEIVKSVSFEASNCKLVGGMRINPETGAFVENVSTGHLSQVTALYSDDPIAVAGEKSSAYLVVAPVTIPTGTSLTFTIETENYDIVKTVSAPEDMVMTSGGVTVINLTIEETNCSAKVEDTSDYSGTYAIVAEKSSKYYYLTNVDNGASTKRLNSSSEMALLPESVVKLEPSFVWNIIKNDDGTYLIQSAENGYYLDHPGDNSSVLTENSEDAVALTIKEIDGKYKISYVNNGEVRNFVKNSSAPYFAFYTSTQCGPVHLVPASIDVSPKIVIAGEDLVQKVNSDATTLTFNYSLKNITGTPSALIATGATMTNLEAVANDGTVTVTFDANEDEVEKTATITLSIGDVCSDAIVITQAAKTTGDEPSTEGFVLVTSLNEVTTGEYIMAAKVNDKYYSFKSASFPSNNTQIEAIEISVTDNKITALDFQEFVITINVEDGKCTIYNGAKYLKYASSTYLNSSTEPYDWSLAYIENEFLLCSILNSERALLYRISTKKFGGFAKSNSSNADYCGINLFKKVASN